MSLHADSSQINYEYCLCADTLTGAYEIIVYKFTTADDGFGNLKNYPVTIMISVREWLVFKCRMLIIGTK